ncbi:uncharacterized protein HD556DRAFT_1308144 [Suillus plorans]|uniref:Non-haem dioxygenase N-terminal domain-containing protein n=1 Tax=Suillus plorans TaxID=116603 RepID=A0A9P7DHE6_9AGAM|nr:uncharacterized protein HD556DRAFT_1308144 [Suillus plorans]KAG1794447.1 hypothetical protein HD556DRAFT_1308144 [Suillus plorans]
MSNNPFPIVDFAPFLDGSAKQQAADKLLGSFKSYGFFYLTNFGISNEEVQEMFDLGFHWKAGFWQYNTAYNMNGAGPGVHWAPSMGWAQNVPANFNPYKRVPRPASPSYRRTQLTDNGLGFGEHGPCKRSLSTHASPSTSAIHLLKLTLEKLALLSGIPLSVVRKVFFEENLMFDGNVTREVVGGLSCGVVTKECRTGRRMHMASVLTLPRILIGDSDGYSSMDDPTRELNITLQLHRLGV